MQRSLDNFRGPITTMGLVGQPTSNHSIAKNQPTRMLTVGGSECWAGSSVRSCYCSPLPASFIFNQSGSNPTALLLLQGLNSKKSFFRPLCLRARQATYFYETRLGNRYQNQRKVMYADEERRTVERALSRWEMRDDDERATPSTADTAAVSTVTEWGRNAATFEGTYDRKAVLMVA